MFTASNAGQTGDTVGETAVGSFGSSVRGQDGQQRVSLWRQCFRAGRMHAPVFQFHFQRFVTHEKKITPKICQRQFVFTP